MWNLFLPSRLFEFRDFGRNTNACIFFLQLLLLFLLCLQVVRLASTISGYQSQTSYTSGSHFDLENAKIYESIASLSLDFEKLFMRNLCALRVSARNPLQGTRRWSTIYYLLANTYSATVVGGWEPFRAKTLDIVEWGH